MRNDPYNRGRKSNVIWMKNDGESMKSQKRNFEEQGDIDGLG